MKRFIAAHGFSSINSIIIYISFFISTRKERFNLVKIWYSKNIVILVIVFPFSFAKASSYIGSSLFKRIHQKWHIHAYAYTCARYMNATQRCINFLANNVSRETSGWLGSSVDRSVGWLVDWFIDWVKIPTIWHPHSISQRVIICRRKDRVIHLTLSPLNFLFGRGRIKNQRCIVCSVREKFFLFWYCKVFACKRVKLTRKHENNQMEYSMFTN